MRTEKKASDGMMDCLGGTRSARATKQAFGLGTYGNTLIVLTCPSVRDETFEEDEGDYDLAERWTLRFRK